MSHSLELRGPLRRSAGGRLRPDFADRHKLCPDNGMNSAGRGKKVLVHALKDVLPPEIVNLPKRGFTLPMVHWMQTSLGVLRWRRRAVRKPWRGEDWSTRRPTALWANLAAGRTGVLFPRLWSLMILELWCRAVLDQPQCVALTLCGLVRIGHAAASWPRSCRRRRYEQEPYASPCSRAEQKPSASLAGECSCASLP